MEKNKLILAVVGLVLIGIAALMWMQHYWGGSRYATRYVRAPYGENTWVVTSIRVPIVSMYDRNVIQGLFLATLTDGNNFSIGFSAVDSSGVWSGTYDAVAGYEISKDGDIYLYAHIPDMGGWYTVRVGTVTNPLSATEVGDLIVSDDTLVPLLDASGSTAGLVKRIFITDKYVFVLAYHGYMSYGEDVLLIVDRDTHSVIDDGVFAAQSLGFMIDGNVAYFGGAMRYDPGRYFVGVFDMSDGSMYTAYDSDHPFGDPSGLIRAAFLKKDGQVYFGLAAQDGGYATLLRYRVSYDGGSVSMQYVDKYVYSNPGSVIGLAAGPNDFVMWVKAESSVDVCYVDPVTGDVVYTMGYVGSDFVNSPFISVDQWAYGDAVRVTWMFNSSGTYIVADQLQPDGNYAYVPFVSVVSGKVYDNAVVAEYNICNLGDVDMRGPDLARVYMRVQNGNVYYYYMKYKIFQLASGECEVFEEVFTPDDLTFAYGGSQDTAPVEFNADLNYEVRIVLNMEQPYYSFGGDVVTYASLSAEYVGGEYSGEVGGETGGETSSSVSGGSVAVTSPPPREFLEPTTGTQPASAVVQEEGVSPSVLVGVIVALVVLLYFVTRKR